MAIQIGAMASALAGCAAAFCPRLAKNGSLAIQVGSGVLRRDGLVSNFGPCLKLSLGATLARFLLRDFAV